jgi:hypothetical protein
MLFDVVDPGAFGLSTLATDEFARRLGVGLAEAASLARKCG